ncbi:MAG: hypothetical protein Q9169_001075 [Polycauliona sp. 2 TL-2023]
MILDMLSPLTRIKIARPVTFIFVLPNGPDRYPADESLTCNRSECTTLAEKVQQTMNRLDGMTLTHEEAAWKRVKEHDHGHSEAELRVIYGEYVSPRLRELWRRLNAQPHDRRMTGREDHISMQWFDSEVAQAERSMQADYTLWLETEARKRREESLRQFLYNGPLAKKWRDGIGSQYERLSMSNYRTKEDEKWLLKHRNEFEAKERERKSLIREWHERD